MLLETPVHGYVSPARVLSGDGSHVSVSLAGATVRARVAVALYRPSPGDLVLTLRQEEDCYVIGVLEVRGPAELAVPGDLRLRVGGSLDLLSARETRIRAPRIALCAVSLTLLAEKALEKFTTVVRRVRECFQLRAGRLRTIVEETSELQAGRIVQKAVRDVKIDGESIDLG